MKISWNNFQVPDNYELFSHLVYGEDDPASQYINLAIPRGKVDFPTLIWFHGGGMGEALCDSNPEMWDGTFAIAVVRYRLAPHAMPPAQYLDAARAIAFVHKNINKYYGSNKKLIIGGLSAGANMAALSCFDTKWLNPYGLSYKDFMGFLLVSGQLTTHFYVKELLHYPIDNAIPIVDEYAPLYHLKADLPPIFMLVGENGIPGRKYENLLMLDTLKALGHKDCSIYIATGATHNEKLVLKEPVQKFIHHIID
ncbi:MAG: alpha/beta hydrolase [Lentisphaeria bacterium]|nr:alpha/beta hydrolase [Lentisphaeria bacterium]